MSAPNPLITRPVRSLFFQYYFPALTTMLSVMAHQVLNGIILSRQVGKLGVTALGLYGPVSMVLVSVTFPVMIGGGILISRSLGENSPKRVQEIFNFSTSLALVFGTLLAVSAPFLADGITSFVAGDQDSAVAQSTSDYILWQFIAAPFFFIRMFWGNALSNDGKPKVSRNANLVAVAINIVFDILLIIVFPMGVAGASVATSLAFLGSALFLFLHIRKETGHFGFRQFRFTLQLADWKTLLNLGTPSFVSEISFALGLLIINRSVLEFGSMAVSSFGTINYVSFIFLRFLTSAMIASLPVMAFNVGAQMPGRVMETARFAISFTFLVGLFVTACGWFFPQWILYIFAGENTAEFDAIAARSLQLYFLLFLAAGPNFIFTAYFQATGKTLLATTVNLLKGVGLLAIFTTALPAWFGLDGIWLSRALSECAALLVGFIFLFYTRKTKAGIEFM